MGPFGCVYFSLVVTNLEQSRSANLTCIFHLDRMIFYHEKLFSKFSVINFVQFLSCSTELVRNTSTSLFIVGLIHFYTNR